MNILVVGLGSMGKRRVRCLQALGVPAEAIVGFDSRADRRAETEATYHIRAFASFDEAVQAATPDALIISVPPHHHHTYMKEAARLRLPFFVEASVVDHDMETVMAACREAGILAAPSSTLFFHPAIRCIRECVQSGRLGKLSLVLYHSGQYLPDWHSYEGVADYYVSNPSTGGGREIVPFELTWLVDVFGFPRRVTGLYRKTIDIAGAERIDDTYSSLLDYGDFLMNLTVDVVSRCATRRLLINGDKAQLRWDWDQNCIELYEPENGAWTRMPYEMAAAQPGYAANIGENMYIDEIKTFLEAVAGKKPFVNTLDKDHAVLKLLYAMERSDVTASMVPVDFVRW